MTKSPKEKEKIYDLEDRTTVFGKDIIELVKDMPKSVVTRPIISQLVKCGTSVGANYCEADDAESGRDFRHKIGICKKEARESKYFLVLAAKAVPKMKDRILRLRREAKELNLIFNKIYKTCKENEKKRNTN